MSMLLPSVGGAALGVVRSLRTNHYVVGGSNLAALRDAMRDFGPRQDGRACGGLTVWALRWTFEARASGGCFRTAQVTVAVDAVVTLPRWVPPRDVDDETHAEWHRFVLALSEHQAGHVAIAQGAAIAVAERLHDLGATSPQALHREGDDLARARIAQARAEDAAYDVRTRHGGTQGARLGAVPRRSSALATSRCA